MQKIKLANALQIANQTLIELEDRDTHDWKNDDNSYALTNLDFEHFSETAIKLNFMIDNDCLYQIAINVDLWLSYDSDNDQMLNENEIDEITKQLDAIADDDYRESNINPSIVRFYRDQFQKNWHEMFKQYAQQSNEPQYMKLLHELVDQKQTTPSQIEEQFNALTIEQQQLVKQFIKSFK